MEDGELNRSYLGTGCAESQSVPMYLDVETSSFYTELPLAEVALWNVTELWLTHSILFFIHLYHSHSHHINGPCLPREKEPLTPTPTINQSY
ncbi:transmembrane protein 179 isoform X2 [Oncorhynchus mykiss]|uniref:transmembrane protein 179 isoform X2 n=1 Tax=Oncorhynchus mykiss TaxID=8022 RepID=UPI001878C229|nr:transmembrane protein 179 isoform X2 [Oncorhynchus mykiss]